MDRHSDVASSGNIEKERSWQPRSWVKRFDGKRVSMDPQPGRSTDRETSVHPELSNSGSVEATSTPPDLPIRDSNIGVQDDAGNMENPRFPWMRNFFRRRWNDATDLNAANGETEAADYGFLFRRIREFLGVVEKEKPVKKSRIQSPAVFGIHQLSEIKCFDCGKNWNEVRAEGSCIRITKCGHFFCHRMIKKLAKTGEKCPQCEQRNVYKSDCKICVPEQ